MLLNNKNPIVVRRRMGTADDPFVNVTDILVVANDGKVTLTELPDRLNRVTVESDGADWFEIEDGRININEYQVDYANKLVTFHHSQIGKQLTFKYKGTGMEFIPVSMIYTKLDEDGSNPTVTETLEDIISGSKASIDLINNTASDMVALKEDMVAATNNANTQASFAQTEANRVDTGLSDLTQLKSTLGATTDNANTQATHAKTQGDYAKLQGDFAKVQGTFANEKGTYAEQQAGNALTQANYAKAQGDFALEQGTNTATQSTYAREQGDYAKTQAQSASTQATQAQTQAAHAKTQGDYAKTQADQTLQTRQSFDTWSTQKTEWLNNVEAILDENVASNLASEISVVRNNVSAISTNVTSLQTNSATKTELQSTEQRLTTYQTSTDATLSGLNNSATQNATNITNVSNSLLSHKNDFMPHDSGMNQYLSNADANGTYTTVTYKRADNTVYLVSTLSNPNTNGHYRTCIWKFYNTDGTTLALTKQWTISYDENGIPTSKEVN